MDEFGVLVESTGFKSQKSAPMAHLKSKPKSNFSFNSGFPQSSSNTSNTTRWNDSFVDDLDGIFQTKNNISNSQKSQQHYDGGFDIFGGPVSSSKPPPSGSLGNIDLESVFDFSNNSMAKSSSTGSVAADDLLDGFGFSPENSKKDVRGNLSQADDLIPGFGDSGPSNNVSGNMGIQPGAYSSRSSGIDASNSTFSEEDDPFSIFEASKSAENDLPRSFSGPSEKHTGRNSVESSIDELEKFAMGRSSTGATEKPSAANTGIRISLNKKDNKATDDSVFRKVHRPEEMFNGKQREKDRVKVEKEKNEQLVNDSIADNFFDMGNDSSQLNRPSTQTKDPIFDALFNNNPGGKVQKAASQAPGKKKTSPSVAVMHDDFHSLFGEAPSAAFQEVEGETEERRRARMNHHLRTQKRMAKALAEKNERDFQTQCEQEERHRIAETLDYNIKRWSAGKEGNLLALLSSLQDVLWPECGWQPVSLTELIAPTSVKKVYHKATLCVHPDKVQQKGSTLQQKYIAEKVFDLLKEAWNKHNSQGPQSNFSMPF